MSKEIDCKKCIHRKVCMCYDEAKADGFEINDCRDYLEELEGASHE